MEIGCGLAADGMVNVLELSRDTLRTICRLTSRKGAGNGPINGSRKATKLQPSVQSTSNRRR